MPVACFVPLFPFYSFSVQQEDLLQAIAWRPSHTVLALATSSRYSITCWFFPEFGKAHHFLPSWKCMSPWRRSQAGLNVELGLLTFHGMFIIVFKSFSTSLSLASVSWASFIVMSPRNKVERSWAQTKAHFHVYTHFSSQKQPLMKVWNNLKYHASRKCLLTHTDYKACTPNRDGYSYKQSCKPKNRFSCLWSYLRVARQAEVEPPTPSSTVSLHSIYSSDNQTACFLLPKIPWFILFPVNTKQKNPRKNPNATIRR